MLQPPCKCTTYAHPLETNAADEGADLAILGGCAGRGGRVWSYLCKHIEPISMSSTREHISRDNVVGGRLFKPTSRKHAILPTMEFERSLRHQAPQRASASTGPHELFFPSSSIHPTTASAQQGEALLGAKQVMWAGYAHAFTQPFLSFAFFDVLATIRIRPPSEHSIPTYTKKDFFNTWSTCVQCTAFYTQVAERDVAPQNRMLPAPEGR